MNKYTVGMWMYKNGGGELIQAKLISALREREIAVITDLNLAHATAHNGEIICHNVVMEELDAFFSYNAGQQTAYQMYLYQTLNESVACLNNFDSFSLCEDKFRTSHKLAQAGIRTTDYRLCSTDDKHTLKNTIREWDGRLVYKPTDGWGGMGIVKVENERSLDMLMPFLEHTNLRHLYVERYINYDMSDYRVDIVDGQFVGCYGRKAPADDWKTNISSGGTVMPREANDKLIEVALKATEVTGLEIAGVDIIYDEDAEEYVVLEVNGIPAFATPEQEAIGLDFNDKKIELLVDLIERKAHESAAKKTQNTKLEAEIEQQ